jgi:excisionase family DNA binding protein
MSTFRNPIPASIEAATYTVADLAQLMKCSERTVHRMKDERSIPGALKIGRLVRFSKRLVDEWLANGEAPKQ